MIDSSTLIRIASTYAERAGVEMKTVSYRVFGDTKKLPAMMNGADITVSRFNDAVRWFSDNWPADLAWPVGVDRPVSGSGEPSSGNSPTLGVSSPALPGGAECADDAAAGPFNGEAA